MFILDSLFLSGFRWVLDTVRTAAEAEMNDEGALREQLLAAEMRREMGEISDDEFADIEADVLARLREIRERREGGAGPIAFGAALERTPGTTFQVDATVSGDFHEPTGKDPGSAIEHPVDGAPRADEPPTVSARRDVVERRRERTVRAFASPRSSRARRKLPRS